jgi:hypothetical protein
MIIRPYEPPDREEVLTFLHDHRAIDSPGHYIRVAKEDGEVVGVALGIVPGSGEEAFLGPVLLKDARRWDLLYALMADILQQAIDLGFEIGGSDTKSVRMTRHLKDTFGLVGEPSAWNPKTGKPMEWHYRVNLREFLAQLKAVLD